MLSQRFHLGSPERKLTAADYAAAAYAASPPVFVAQTWEGISPVLRRHWFGNFSSAWGFRCIIANVQFSGQGSKVTALHLDEGDYSVPWTAEIQDGVANFIALLHLRGNAAADKLLANVTPPQVSSGEAYLKADGGDYILEIVADGVTWTLAFTPL